MIKLSLASSSSIVKSNEIQRVAQYAIIYINLDAYTDDGAAIAADPYGELGEWIKKRKLGLGPLFYGPIPKSAALAIVNADPVGAFRCVDFPDI